MMRAQTLNKQRELEHKKPHNLNKILNKYMDKDSKQKIKNDDNEEDENKEKEVRLESEEEEKPPIIKPKLVEKKPNNSIRSEKQNSQQKNP